MARVASLPGVHALDGVTLSSVEKMDEATLAIGELCIGRMRMRRLKTRV